MEMFIGEKLMCKNVKRVKSWKEKRIGLIGSDGTHGISFKTRFGIHTFGMGFPIDILILNKKGEIKTYKKALGPNKVFFWNPIYSRVVEIPSALLKDGVVEVNDKIEIS